MENRSKINDLVQTVRLLNWEIRPKIDNTPGGNPPGNPLFLALVEIRDNEIQVSQTIRNMSLAEVDVLVGEGNVIEHSAAAGLGARQILSEFGTAREAILSLLRVFSENDWSRTHDTPGGTKTVEEIIDDLIASDKRSLEKITNAAT